MKFIAAARMVPWPVLKSAKFHTCIPAMNDRSAATSRKPRQELELILFCPHLAGRIMRAGQGVGPKLRDYDWFAERLVQFVQLAG